MTTCWHCKAESPAAHYARVVENRTELHGEWSGWRMSGRFLIAPGNAGRIMPARVLGMLWEEASRIRRDKKRTLCPQAHVIPARELFRGQA